MPILPIGGNSSQGREVVGGWEYTGDPNAPAIGDWRVGEISGFYVSQRWEGATPSWVTKSSLGNSVTTDHFIMEGSDGGLLFKASHEEGPALHNMVKPSIDGHGTVVSNGNGRVALLTSASKELWHAHAANDTLTVRSNPILTTENPGLTTLAVSDPGWDRTEILEQYGIAVKEAGISWRVKIYKAGTTDLVVETHSDFEFETGLNVALTVDHAVNGFSYAELMHEWPVAKGFATDLVYEFASPVTMLGSGTVGVDFIDGWAVKSKELILNDIPSLRKYLAGESYTDGEWSYDPATEKVYECNITGVQTGTFVSNLSKWDVLGSANPAVALNTTHRVEINSANTDDSGKVLHIALNDIGAGTQSDRSAQGNDATPSGGVVVSATGGRYTSGASFDGVADAYSIPVTSGFPTANAPRTVEALVRTTSVGLGAFTIFSYGPDVFRQIFQVRREGSRLEIYNREDVAFSGDGVFIAGKWQEVQVTYNGTVANAWVDKVHVITDFPITLETVATDAYIGRADTDTSSEDFWLGDIDYVRMYDRVLADNALYTSALRTPKIEYSLSDIPLNNAHRLSDGKGHADVVLNNAHRISDGTDHSFIDQDLTIASFPQFSDMVVSVDAITKGVDWVTQASPLNQWTSVVYGNGVFVAIGKNTTANDVMTSPDGITWTSRTTPTGKSWMEVTYGNGLFVAVADGGTAGNRVMTSPDGITWTLRTTPADSNWTSIVYGKGLFVATATTGANRVMTSADGINWTLRSSPLKGWDSVTFGNGTFVAVAILGTQQVMTSTDGFNWTLQTEPVGGSWRAVTFGNGLFVAVGDGTSRVMTSADGINWTLGSVPAANGWNAVTYGNGVFIAVAWTGTGNRVMTSPDGINWTLRTSTEDVQWDAITYGNGVFIAVSVDGVTNRVMTAGAIIAGVVISDTLNQDVRNTSSPTFDNLTLDNDLEVAGNTLTKGVTWTAATEAADELWNATAYGNGLFVAVSRTGAGMGAMSSPDGKSWKLHSTLGIGWNGLTYGNGLFVAVGGSASTDGVITSNSGRSWNGQVSAAALEWEDVTYGGGTFVAVASTGTGSRAMFSNDGKIWTLATTPADNDWKSVVYGNGLFVAIASSGVDNRVMTSVDGVTWTLRIGAVDNNWKSITYGNGIFVAVSDTGTGDRVKVSLDGITWWEGSNIADDAWQDVTYGNGLFVAVSSTSVMTSSDAITWKVRAVPANNTWASVVYGNGLFVSVADTGTGTGVMLSGKPEETIIPEDGLFQGERTFTDVVVNNYTQLGSDAPAIKFKKLTGTTAATEGAGVVIAHGLDRTKILTVDILVDDGALSIGPGGAVSPGRVFTRQVSPFDVEVWTHTTDSENILSKPFTVLITYEA